MSIAPEPDSGVEIMFDGQVAITLENSIKHGDASVSVSGNDDAWCNAMRECRPGRGKDRIERDERNARLARKQIFANVVAL